MQSSRKGVAAVKTVFATPSSGEPREQCDSVTNRIREIMN